MMSEMRISDSLSCAGARERSSSQSFTSHDEVWFLRRGLEYPPVFVAQRVIGKNIQSILIVKNNRETSRVADFNPSHQELPRFILE
jgi:hypothetical protein